LLSFVCFVFWIFFPFFFLFCIKKNNNDIHLLKKNACLGNVLILHNSDKRNKETVSEWVSEWVSECCFLRQVSNFLAIF
jgi:hypothetical protein